jgi:quercetin dioxygenase-like cupin family protein
MRKVVITTVEDAPKVPFNLDGKILFSNGKLEMIHLALKPGEKMETHIQPFDVVFYVLSGEGMLECGQQSIKGTPRCCIHVPAGIQRSWGNVSDEEFTVLVVKDLK